MTEIQDDDALDSVVYYSISDIELRIIRRMLNEIVNPVVPYNDDHIHMANYTIAMCRAKADALLVRLPQPGGAFDAT